MAMRGRSRTFTKAAVLMVFVGAYAIVCVASSGVQPASRLSEAWAAGAPSPSSGPLQATAPCDPTAARNRLWGMTGDEARCRSLGCLDCHGGSEDIHNGKVNLGCIDCHGGHAEVRLPSGAQKGSAEYNSAKDKAHVQPRYGEVWRTAANPPRTAALLNKESIEFVQFVNPGDLRVANRSCGNSECHPSETYNVGHSMMTTGAMLWGAALYNNGSYPLKNYRFGESYSADGKPQRLITVPAPTAEDTAKRGVLPFLDPFPRWEISQMGNILRTFERGGRKAVEVGLPNPEESPGKPTQNLLSPRGLGTLLRTDPVFLGLQKTRLLDPMLSFLGTNDQPGDYRSSGCTACHVVYANDRDSFHSGPYARYGHDGATETEDLALREARDKKEPGHPIKHQFTRAIPSSQCVVCHMHPGTLVLMSYYGTTWWDLETDGEKLYPALGDKNYKPPTPAEEQAILSRNPEESALRGKWRSVDFLRTLRDDVNPTLKHTQFADFNGHGWIFRDVFKKDRRGNFLDSDGNIVLDPTADKMKRAVEGTTEDVANKGLPVHLKDIHLEKGMHCVDCHFRQDNHGDGKLYGEVRNAVEIDCVDCHGTLTRRADPTSSDSWTSAALVRAQAGRLTNPSRITEGDIEAAAKAGNRMVDYRELDSGKDRFFKDKDGNLYQRASVSKDKDGRPVVWRVKQV
ncbi:MAG TPA: hypothetical protein VKM94_10620, partial [Blastocatellia bacterium]|nr:hypothetical protein [Blastocatellia bacterium]